MNKTRLFFLVTLFALAGCSTTKEANKLIDLLDKCKPKKALLVAPHLHD